MSGIFQSGNRGEPWNGLRWELDSLAVVANDGGGNGCVLWTVGAHVAFEQQEGGLCQLGDLGLDDAPLGISIWTGKFIWSPGSWEHPQDGSVEPVGRFRPPTDDEWTAIHEGRCPWDEAAWYAEGAAEIEEAVLSGDVRLADIEREGGA
jgi:hypothetical protein